MNQLEEFAREYRLTPRWAADVFGVSPRTWRRWRRRGTCPRHARDMMAVIRDQAAPINHSVPRGPWIGVQLEEFRERLYGRNWRAWSPLAPPARHHWRRR